MQDIIEAIWSAAFERNEHLFPSRMRESSCWYSALPGPATLAATVEEPPFRDTVPLFQGPGMAEQGAVTGKELGVAPAAFVHQLPERPVGNCLPDPGNLCQRDMEVVEGKQAFAILRGPEFLGSM